MIHTDRLTRQFLTLASIDNPSRQEAAVSTYIKTQLDELSIQWREDGTGAIIHGNAGNLYGYLPGQLDLPPILLSAHMDSVDPAVGKRPILHPDGTITSDGTTVLGADDLSGVAAILEAVRSVQESGAAHRPIELLFDVAEEPYCAGIQHFDFPSLQSKEAYILDLTGPVGSAAYQAPSILAFKAQFTGRAAHAAFSPELGIHAIQAAAQAVVSIPCGRVGDTTVNVGTITGGSADNVVPEQCCVTGEVRSFDDGSARARLAEIEATVKAAAQAVGAEVEFSTETLCLAYRVEPDHPVAERFQKVCADLDLSGELTVTYGGSDNNHFFHHGISGLVVASGMNSCHACQEYSSVSELERAARLVEGLILSKE